MSKIIVIDPGHGGSDPGAVYKDLMEKVLTLDISKRIKTFIEDNYEGIKVLMTRTNDKYISLSERAQFANRNNADLFVSIHINAGGGTGYESYIHTSQNSNTATGKMQNTVHSEAIKKMKVTDRGKKKANFAVLRETNMRAILPENLFIDRKEDAAKLKKSSELQKIAEGHAIGIAKSLGLKSKKGGGTSQTKPKPKPSKPATKPKSKPTQKKATGPIATIQDTLNKRYNTNIAVDNLTGPATRKALITGLQTELNTQFNAGLSVDGLWGPKTRNAVVNVYQGARGNLTWILQAMLVTRGYNVGDSGVDGIFGKDTVKAVKSFQRNNKLADDGIAGKATFAKLR